MDLSDTGAHIVFLYVIIRYNSEKQKFYRKKFQVKKLFLFLSSGVRIDLKKLIKRSRFSHKNPENHVYFQIESCNPSRINA
jgi:hypothetical protein